MPIFFGNQGQPSLGQTPPGPNQGMGQPQQQGGPQGPPQQPMPGPQQRQSVPGQPNMPASHLWGGPPQEWSPQTTPWESAVRDAEQALMQAQMSGMPPSQIAQLQMNLQNAQRDAQSADQNRAAGDRRGYLEAMQQAARPIGAGSIGGWGQTSGPTSHLQQDPMLGQLLQNQFGQGFSSGGGPRT